MMLLIIVVISYENFTSYNILFNVNHAHINRLSVLLTMLLIIVAISYENFTYNIFFNVSHI